MSLCCGKVSFARQLLVELPEHSHTVMSCPWMPLHIYIYSGAGDSVIDRFGCSKIGFDSQKCSPK